MMLRFVSVHTANYFWLPCVLQAGNITRCSILLIIIFFGMNLCIGHCIPRSARLHNIYYSLQMIIIWYRCIFNLDYNILCVNRNIYINTVPDQYRGYETEHLPRVPILWGAKRKHIFILNLNVLLFLEF